MQEQFEIVRQHMRQAMSPRSPLDRLASFRAAFAMLDRIESLCDEQTACIDAVEQGLNEQIDEDLEDIFADPFLPFPNPEGQTDDMLVVNQFGEEWTLSDILAREA